MIRGYMAASLDGFIADPHHRLDYLDAYGTEDTGYGALMAEVRTLVMGRNTWAFCAGLDVWPYPDHDTILLTHRPMDRLTPRTTVWSGDLDALAAHLSLLPQDVWIVGGGGLQQAFMERKLLHRLDLFIVPEMLGDGIRLFPLTGGRQTLHLSDSTRHGQIAHLTFTPREQNE